jgi:hypothetical protein
MDDRRLRRRVLALGLGLSVGVLCLVTHMKFHPRVIVCHGPAVREPEPFEGAEPSVEVAVQLVNSLEPIGPADFQFGKIPALQTFHFVDWSQKESGRFPLELGLTNGYAGPAVRILLDARRHIAFASAWYSRGWGPLFDLGWENLRGTVKLVDWNLAPTSLVEVDIQGEVDGQTYSLHLCHDLRP